MTDAIINGLSGLTVGMQMLAGDWRNGIMLVVGFVLLYLGIKKDCEPLLLVPIGFGCILVNIPLSDVMSQEGFIRVIYDAGIATELFPLLIFIGIGAMTDFGPVLAQPSTFLLGAAGQFGEFGGAGFRQGLWQLARAHLAGRLRRARQRHGNAAHQKQGGQQTEKRADPNHCDRRQRRLDGIAVGEEADP